MNLPKLKGTEKQVAWAEKIRKYFMDRLENFADDPENIEDFNLLYDTNLTEKEINKIINYIAKKDEASYYIDNRDLNIYQLMRAEMENALKEEEEAEKEEAVEAKEESTVRPENAVTERAAEIKVADEKVSVLFKKDDTFISIVKDLGYKWSGYAWEKKINKFNGPAADRAAELGNKLLNAGFPVCIQDEKIRQMAVEGAFHPEQTRWIKRRASGKYKGWLAISWEGFDDELYKKARSLPGSKWSNPNVVVKVDYYREVEEFAKLYGFKFSDGAKRAIEAHKAEERG